jgi:hypothetical protein
MLNVVIVSDVMLSDVMLSDVMLSDVMLSDVMLSDVMLSDVMLNDVMLSVVAIFTPLARFNTPALVSFLWVLLWAGPLPLAANIRHGWNYY